MMPSLRRNIVEDDSRMGLFWAFMAVVLLSAIAAMISGEYLLILAPAIVLSTYLLLVDLRLVFFLLLACIPLSTEVLLPGGLGTDLPTEPMMWLLTLAAALYTLRHGWERPLANWRHPLSLLLFLHLGWIAITVMPGVNGLVSAKYLLAKTWYIIPFYLLAGFFLRRPADLSRLFWFIFIPLTATVLITLVRHAQVDFAFSEVHTVLHPFYRNHVIYAALLVVFFPYLWFMLQWQERGSFPWLVLLLSIPLYLVAIYFAYTRAAYIALFVAVGAHLVVNFRLTKYVLIACLAAAIGLLAFLTAGNRYLEYAPNYERTISHRDFNNLIEATYQLEDISTMERLYRWVAGGFMVVEKPWLGVGPGNFYPTYKSYTVTSFQTYVSNNPDRSGIHNYYLMILVEQGIPGLLLFLILVMAALLYGERLYHSLKERKNRQMVLMALYSLIVILTLSLINDLIETDKIGPFFFISLAILVNMDEKQGSEVNSH